MRALLLLPALLLIACTESTGPPAASASPAASPAATGEVIDTIDTAAGPVEVVEVATGLEHPWGIAFLPDGRALVTERPGRLHLLDDGALTQVSGVPDVAATGQGGLLDVALHPDFATNGHVYLTYAKPGPRSGTAATAVGRGTLDGDALVGFEEVWVQTPFVGGGYHFGSRVAFTPDGMMLVSTGDRGQKEPAQELGNTIGALVRLTPDGAVPDGNPFVGDPGARPEIWSYGHRNGQSLAVDPASGDVWEAEFGPRGGDELNLIAPGTNYGWPLVSWGSDYDGTPIADPDSRPDLVDAVRYWDPVISPSGMAFYTGDAVPEWAGSLLIGSLGRRGIVRLTLADGAVTGEETIELGARIRDVQPGPDGAVYVLTDAPNGAVLKLQPADS